MKHLSKAIIIGSGVAGLACAIRLAVQGFEVTVFEKNNYPGGKIGHLNLDGYSFDTGPSMFTQPQNLEELFSFANEPLEDFFQYQPLPLSCRYFYEDGTILNAYSNPQKFAEELHEKISEDGSKLLSYLRRSSKLYNSIGNIFLNHSLHKIKTWLQWPVFRTLMSVRCSYLFGSLNSINVHSFLKSHTVQLFNRYATYNGSNPYKAPGMLIIIPHLECNEGVFYPKGGMISIINALYRLALKKGVRVHFNSPVESIIHHAGSIRGVVAVNENHYSDIVISNMDIYFTYKNLLKDENKSDEILKQERSSSALIFYWGIKKTFPQLHLHNVFFSKNYGDEFHHLFKLRTLYNDPTVYINITGKIEPGIHAQRGKENWFVMVNAPANTGQDWDLMKQQCRVNIIAKLNRLLQTDIESLIEVEEVLDPVSIEENTSSFMGSLYGTSSNSKMAAFLRHPNFSTTIEGLYFAGGSVHPGGGIPLCLKSAKITCELIGSYKKKIKH